MSIRFANSPSRLLWLILLMIAGMLLVFPGLVIGTSIPISNELTMSDLLDVGMPLQSFAARTLAGGRLPLWYPGCYGGLPLASIPEAVPYYPFAIPFYMVFPLTRACAWILAFHLLLAGVGAGLLAGRLGASLPGQALTALATGLGLWLPNHFRQTNMMFAAAWVPWVWLALERWLERPTVRRATVLGLAGGAQALGGHLQILHNTAVLLGLWTLARLAFMHGPLWPGNAGSPAAETGKALESAEPSVPAEASQPARPRSEGARMWLRRLTGLALAAALTIAISGPHLFPVAEMARLSQRERLLAQHSSQPPRPDPAFLLTLIVPFRYGSPVTGDVSKGIVHVGPAQYIGLLPLLLAVGMLGLGWRKRDARHIWGLLTFFLLASLWLACAQCWDITAWTLRLVPGMSRFRFPFRALWFTSLALALAGGLGLTWALGYLDRRYGRRARRPLLLVAVAVPLIALVDMAATVRFFCPVRRPGALLEEPMSGRMLREAGADPTAFGERVALRGNLRVLSSKAFIAARGWSGQTTPYVELRQLLHQQHASLWGWQTVLGYIALAPSWTRDAIGDNYQPGMYLGLDPAFNPGSDKASLDRWADWAGLIGGRWVLAAEAINHESLSPIGALKGQTLNCFLYENKRWAGPARIYHRAASGVEKEASYLFHQSADFQSEVVIAESRPEAERMAAPPPGSEETLDVKSARPERIQVHCCLAAPGIVLLNQGYHPRWRFRIDGGNWQKPVRVNLCQTAFFVGPGEHRVELRFDGRLEKISLAVALLTLLACGVVLVRDPLARPNEIKGPKGQKGQKGPE